MRKKRFLAVLLTAAMTMSSSVLVFGAPVPVTDQSKAMGSTTGSGKLEGYLNKEVFSVELPTLPADATKSPFNFYLDPQGLIEATGGIKYTSGNSGKNDGAVSVSDYGTLYFKNTVSADKPALSTNSDKLTITNKGAISVNVRLSAEVAKDGGIAISDNTNLNTTEASMYLQLVDSKGVKTLISGNGTSRDTTVSGAASGDYKVSYNATDGYSFKVLSEGDATYGAYDFRLTGSCNDTSAWADLQKSLTSNQPQIKVTWDVKPEDYVYPVAPSIVGATEYQLQAGNDVTVRVDFGQGSAAAVSINRIGNVTAGAPLDPANYEFDEATKTLTIKSSFTDLIANNNNLESGTKREFKVVFVDENGKEILVSFYLVKP